jgi:transposase
MMSQEEYMEQVLALRRQGLTIKEVAAAIGYHPATVSFWLKNGGPPAARAVADEERVIDPRWAGRIAELLRPAPALLATSVFEIITAEGFEGSYPTVARHLRDLRGPRFRRAAEVSVPIETAPGEEAQFDWSDCSAWTERWGLGEVWCFGCILCWSRFRTWWFTTSIDREHTFEGLVRALEAFGGVPQVGRTDRMGALGSSQGRRFKLHPPTLDFACHHGLEIKVCLPGDAKRKGKCERPFRDLKEGFLTECDALGPPASLAELNERSQRWLEERCWSRPHRTTGAAPAERLAQERPLLGRLPRRRFNTAYVDGRRVHVAVPLVPWNDVRYSVPPECLGQAVTCRQEVDSDQLEIHWAGRVVAHHRLVPPGSEDQWDPDHRQAAEAAALARAAGRPFLRVVPAPEPAEPSPMVPVGLPDGDFAVAPIDLAARYGGCGCTGKGTR